MDGKVDMNCLALVTYLETGGSTVIVPVCDPRGMMLPNWLHALEITCIVPVPVSQDKGIKGANAPIGIPSQ